MSVYPSAVSPRSLGNVHTLFCRDYPRLAAEWYFIQFVVTGTAPRSASAETVEMWRRRRTDLPASRRRLLLEAYAATVSKYERETRDRLDQMRAHEAALGLCRLQAGGA
jgi:hypothetical protein